MTPAEVGLVEAVFHRAMLQGYAVEAQPGTIAELPGSKCTRYQEGDLLVVDCWQKNRETGKSFGNTIIYRTDGEIRAVWMMHYWGWYSERGAAVLKQALAHQYRASEPLLNTKAMAPRFTGCRGPREFCPEGSRRLVYLNQSVKGCFAEFSGRETVLDLDQPQGARELGWHEYHGWSLV